MATTGFVVELDDDGVPFAEMYLAEELAECISDPAFPPLSNSAIDEYIDTLAGLYAVEDDNEED